MELAELDLQSGLWQMLHIYQSPSGWTVRDLAAICSRLADEELTALYLAPEAEDRFRAFVRESPFYFRYDSEQDRVFPSSEGAALEAWLVRYLALQVEVSGGCLEIKDNTVGKNLPALPRIMANHLLVIYGECLPLFVKTHPDDFFIDENDNQVWVTPALREKNLAAFVEEESLTAFFVGLLHKIGATKERPCSIHTLSKYTCFMTKEEKELLYKRYHTNLKVFFLLNPANFAMTKPEKGCVFLKNPDPRYGTALFLRQQLQTQSKAGDEQPAKVALAELAARVKYSSSPVVQGIFGAETHAQQVRDIVALHPTVFHFDEADCKLWLQKTYPAWKGEEWNADTELMAVAYYIDLLRDIGAMSHSSAINFNYISRTVSAAPVTCKDYLENVYPGLDILDLFHLHPTIFDLSLVNRVSLKMAGLGAELKTSHVPVRQQAVQFAGKLMKYVDRMDPDLLALCVESAAPAVQKYCREPVKNRLRSVIDSARNAELAHVSHVVQSSKTTTPAACAQSSSEAEQVCNEQIKTSGKLVQASSEPDGKSNKPTKADSKPTQSSTVLKETGYDLTKTDSEPTKPSSELEEISNRLTELSAGLKETNNGLTKTNSEATQPSTEQKQTSSELQATCSEPTAPQAKSQPPKKKAKSKLEQEPQAKTTVTLKTKIYKASASSCTVTNGLSGLDADSKLVKEALKASAPTVLKATKKIKKLKKSVAPPEEAKTGSQSNGKGLLQIIDKIAAKLLPSELRCGSSGETLPSETQKKGKDNHSSKGASKITVEVSKISICKTENS